MFIQSHQLILTPDTKPTVTVRVMSHIRGNSLINEFEPLNMFFFLNCKKMSTDDRKWCDSINKVVVPYCINTFNEYHRSYLKNLRMSVFLSHTHAHTQTHSHTQSDTKGLTVRHSQRHSVNYQTTWFFSYWCSCHCNQSVSSCTAPPGCQNGPHHDP